jgi:hypothetical protein
VHGERVRSKSGARSVNGLSDEHARGSRKKALELVPIPSVEEDVMVADEDLMP